jgi:pimeloyl-ACP methyl ester carboxylesterase
MTLIQRRFALDTGVELDVWSAGDPAHPPMIFLHGFPESHRTWLHQLDAFRHDHYVIAPDQRGYARSSKPPAVSDYAPDRMVADLFALADAMGIGAFTLVAHDWGGAIAWAAALARPQRVSRLIICNAPHPLIFQRTLLDDPAQRLASQYIRVFRERIEAQIDENSLEWFFDHSFMRHLKAVAVSAETRAAYLDEWSQPGAMTAMLNWYRATPLYVPAVNETPERPTFLDQSFPKTVMPVLIVWGEKDPALLPCQLDGLDDLTTDLTISRVDCGHFTPWEAPADVNAAIRAFLDSRPPSART